MSNFRLRELGVRALSLDPNESDLAAIRRYQAAGEPVTAEEIHTRRMLLCHDRHDRAFERFPESYLARFAQTTPGKAVLTGHDTHQAPLARFYGGALEDRTEDFPTPTVKDGAVVWEERPQKVKFLVTPFFFVRDPGTELMRKNIDLGVWSMVSIGYRYDRINCDLCEADYLGRDCPHIFGKVVDDRVGTGTYAGNAALAETREGSFVYLGCQPNARVEQLAADQVRAGQVDPKKLAATPFGEDLVALKWAEGLAREHGHAQKSWAFPALSCEQKANRLTAKPTPLEDSMDVEKLKADLNAASEQLKTLTTERDELKSRAEAAEKISTAALDGAQKRYLDHALKADGKELQPEREEIAAALAAKGNLDRLTELADAAQKRAAAKFGSGRLSADVKAATGGDPEEDADEGKALRERLRERARKYAGAGNGRAG
jgi:hypothetical protein